MWPKHWLVFDSRLSSVRFAQSCLAWRRVDCERRSIGNCLLLPSPPWRWSEGCYYRQASDWLWWSVAIVEACSCRYRNPFADWGLRLLLLFRSGTLLFRQFPAPLRAGNRIIVCRHDCFARPILFHAIIVTQKLLTANSFCNTISPLARR